MISAVLDTNVLVSGMGWPRSVPGRVVAGMVEGRFVVVTSRELLEELRRVLDYPKLRRFVTDADRLVSLVAETCVVVEPTRRVEVVSDEVDNRLREVALAGGADFVVTEDGELLALGAFEGARIVAPREFLEVLRSDPR